MRYCSLLLSIIVVIFIFLAGHVSASYAASLQLDPATASVAVGQTVNIKVNISSGTETVRSTDAFVSYDSAYFETPTVTNGTFFQTAFQNIDTTRVYVAGLQTDPASTVQGTGTIATITFRAKKSGSTRLTFVCGTNTANDSTIVAGSGSANIIQCSSNGSSTITIAGDSSSPAATATPASGATSTPVPTSVGTVGGATAVPTAVTQLPQSGIEQNITTYVALGVILFIVGIGARFLLL